VNVIHRLKSLPVQTKRLLGLGTVLALFIALPLFIWAIVTQTFLFREKAASGEPGVCVAVNKTIIVTPETDIDGTCHDIQTAVNAANDSGFTILIKPGTYNPPSTINVSGKSNLKITGESAAGNGAAVINFNPGGWGFLVQNSTGSIEWLTIQGGSSNGMLSIRNSNYFSVGYSKISSNSSHTFDAQNSQDILIYNTEIRSSAGGIEFGNINGIRVLNSNITDTANAIAIYDSQNIDIRGNLINGNRESAITLQNSQSLRVERNTIVNNAMNGSLYPAVRISGNANGNYEFNNNILAYNQGAGIKFEAQNFMATFQRNDVWNNTGGNYVGIADATGINGNISADPKINFGTSSAYCLLSDSPAIYGNTANNEYMGHRGPCSMIRPPAGECQMCGGIAGIGCATGLTCQMSRPRYPDQSGICVKTDGTSQCSSPTPTPLPYINLISPNGGETLVSGQTYQIRWNTSPNIYSVNINYYNNITSNTVVTDATNSGTFNWIVPAVPAGASNQFKIQISAYPGIYIEDYSANYFYIVAINPTTNPSPTPNTNPPNCISPNIQAPTGPAPLTVTLPGGSNAGNGAGIEGYRWDFENDGTWDTGIQLNAITHTYTSAGTYNPVFQVRNVNGIYSSVCTYPFSVIVNPTVAGDVNGDGQVNIVDIGIIVDNYRLSPPDYPAADLNHDGLVNIIDIGIVVDNYQS
jgi:hypothetical protein